MANNTMWVKLGLQTADFQKNMKQTQRELKKLQASFKDLTLIGGGLTAAITVPFAKIAKETSELQIDFVELKNRFQQSFKGMENSAQKMAKTLDDSFGYSRSAALETLSRFNDLAKGMGLARSQASKFAKTQSQLSADLSSYLNLPIDEVQQKLISGFAGQYETLRTLNIYIDAAKVKTEALSMGLISEGQELDNVSKALATQSLILKATTDAQGDFGRTSNQLANVLRDLQGNFTDINTSIGAIFTPLLEAVLKPIKDLSARIKDMSDMFENLSPAVRRAVSILGSFVAAIPAIIAGIGALGLAFVTFKMMNPELVALSAIIAGVTLAVGALVAAGTYLYETNSDVRQIFNQVADSFKAFYRALKPVIGVLWEFGKDILKGTVLPVLTSVILLIGGLAQNLTGLLTLDWGMMTDGAQNMLKGLRKIVDAINGMIFSAFKGLARGIVSLFGESTLKAFDEFMQKVLDKIVSSVNTAISLLNKLPLVNIGKVAKLTWKSAPAKPGAPTATDQPNNEDAEARKRRLDALRNEIKANQAALQTEAQNLKREYSDRIKQAKGNKEELLLIDKWYNSEKAILDKKTADERRKQREQEQQERKREISDTINDMKNRMKSISDAAKTPMQLLTADFKDLMKTFKGTKAESFIKDWFSAATIDLQKAEAENTAKVLEDIRISAMENGKERELAILKQNLDQQLKTYENNEKIKTALTEKFAKDRRAIEDKYSEQSKTEAKLKKVAAWDDMRKAIIGAADALDSKFLRKLDEVINRSVDFKDNILNLQDSIKTISDSYGKFDLTNIFSMTGGFMNMLGAAKNIFSGITHLADKLIGRSADDSQQRMQQVRENADAVRASIQQLGVGAKYTSLQLYSLFSTSDIQRLIGYREALNEYIRVSKTSLGDMLKAARGTWGFTADQLKAFSDYAVKAGKSADYYTNIFNKSVSNLSVNDYNAVNAVIQDMSDNIDTLKTGIIDMLGISPQKLAETLSGAFSETDLTGFKENIYASVDTTIRNAVISGFMSGTALQDIYENLSDAVFEAVRDGVMSASELANIRGIAEQLEAPMTAMYSTLEQLGLGVQKTVEGVSSTITETVESIDISGIFETETFSGLAENLENTVMSSVKQGFIKAALESAAIKPLLDQLNAVIKGALEFGGISDTEMGNIRSSYEALLQPLKTIFDRLRELGLGFENLSGTTSALNSALDTTEKLMNAPTGFQTAGYRTAATMPGNAPISGQISVNGNNFTIIANNPIDLFEELQKLQKSASVTQTGSPINSGSLYGTGG